MRTGSFLALLTLLPPAAGCATTLERSMEADLAQRGDRLARAGDEDSTGADDVEPPGPAVALDGGLERYVAYALKHSPSLREKFELWRAATKTIAQQWRLPEPTFTYGLYLSRVETRVGPQRHRFSLSQALPWPGRLAASADAASLEARSAERRFDAAALAVVRRVSAGYWALWVVERTAQVQRDQLEVLGYLADSARARLEIGKSNLATLGQIDLSISRLTDDLSGLEERRASAAADLVAAMGAPAGTTVRVSDAAPPLRAPTEKEEQLRDAVRAHPAIEALGLAAESRDERATAARAEGFPSFIVGADYIETGPAEMPGVADSGKDAVVLNLGVRLPIWWNVYGAAEDQALAESAAMRATQSASLVEAQAELAKALSAVRDSARRVKLYRGTLLPQAETVYGSLLGGFQTGDSPLAQVLLGQRDLLALQLGLFQAQTDHAVAWARLEEVVGRSVRSREAR